MNTSDQIIEKIRKCLALANGKNATSGEMEAAMVAAKRIANANNIEIASIDWAKNPNEKPALEAEQKDFQFRSKKEQIYHRFIYHVLQAVYDVKILSNCYRLTVIGEKTDIAICQVIFPWLEDVFYTTYYRAMKEGKVQSCAGTKRSIYAGLSRGLINVNVKAEQDLDKDAQQTMAMVVRDKKKVVEDFFHATHPKVGKRKDLARSLHNGAYQIGIAAGEKIRLNGISAGKGTCQLTA